MSAIEKNIMKPRRSKGRKQQDKEFEERVVEIARVSRVVKGGRRIRFRALVVIGNKKGKVGMGIATANEVADAIRKASSQAKKNIIEVPVIEGTIPHDVTVKYCGSKILMKPASPGTSIVAGGAVRTVVELAGVSDVLAKILGSNNKVNNVYATMKALSSFNQIIVEKLQKMSKEQKRKEVTSDKPKADTKKKTASFKEVTEKKPTGKKTKKTKSTAKNSDSAKSDNKKNK